MPDEPSYSEPGCTCRYAVHIITGAARRAHHDEACPVHAEPEHELEPEPDQPRWMTAMFCSVDWGTR
jgi:hypothetical protein